VAVGSEPTAAVLDDDQVAAAGGADGIEASEHAGVLFAVRPAGQQHRPRAAAGRPVGVRAQDGAVAHRRFEVEFGLDLKRRLIRHGNPLLVVSAAG
jgi:hypothetical protein